MMTTGLLFKKNLANSNLEYVFKTNNIPHSSAPPKSNIQLVHGEEEQL